MRGGRCVGAWWAQRRLRARDGEGSPSARSAPRRGTRARLTGCPATHGPTGCQAAWRPASPRHTAASPLPLPTSTGASARHSRTLRTPATPGLPPAPPICREYIPALPASALPQHWGDLATFFLRCLRDLRPGRRGRRGPAAAFLAQRRDFGARAGDSTSRTRSAGPRGRARRTCTSRASGSGSPRDRSPPQPRGGSCLGPAAPPPGSPSPCGRAPPPAGSTRLDACRRGARGRGPRLDARGRATRTLTVFPCPAEVRVQVAAVAPVRSRSEVPSFAIHCHAWVALAKPSASAIPAADAVSVSPGRPRPS